MRIPRLPNLSRRIAAKLPGVPKRPGKTGIVHLGLGNFHRAHQAVYTAAAMRAEPGPWGILAAANSSRTLVAALAAQDLLYAVAELSQSGVEVSIPSVHTGLLIAAEDPSALIAAIAAPATQIVTMTVTEHGYAYSPQTLGLDLDAPQVKYDLEHRDTPQTPVGIIVRALQRRMAAGGAGLTVLSCDNLMNNGRRIARLVRDFVGALPTHEGADLLGWINAHVTFPNTMVDRIVPATTDVVRSLVTERLGVLDAVPVPTEPFKMWVLQNTFAAGRPRWEAGGAIMTDDVGPYEVLKLRLLNGTHSLIAYLGLLAGQQFIAEAIRLPFIEEAARRVMAEDYLPTFSPPEGLDVESYVEQLFARFGNAALGHRTEQVASGGSLKLPQRITEPALENRRAGRMPDFLALTIAAFLCCTAPIGGHRPAGTEEVTDPALDQLAELAATATTSAELVTAAFDLIFAAELAADAEFLARTAEFVDILRTYGPAAAVAATR